LRPVHPTTRRPCQSLRRQVEVLDAQRLFAELLDAAVADHLWVTRTWPKQADSVAERPVSDGPALRDAHVVDLARLGVVAGLHRLQDGVPGLDVQLADQK